MAQSQDCRADVFTRLLVLLARLHTRDDLEPATMQAQQRRFPLCLTQRFFLLKPLISLGGENDRDQTGNGDAGYTTRFDLLLAGFSVARFFESAL